MTEEKIKELAEKFYFYIKDKPEVPIEVKEKFKEIYDETKTA